MVLSEEFCMSMKKPLTLAGIEPETFRFAAQHLTHCATAVPHFNTTYIVILATCFDSYESSSGINIQELLVHIVLQFFMS